MVFLAIFITIWGLSLALDLIGFAVKPDYFEVYKENRKYYFLASLLPIINTRMLFIIWFDDDGSSRLR